MTSDLYIEIYAKIYRYIKSKSGARREIYRANYARDNVYGVKFEDAYYRGNIYRAVLKFNDFLYKYTRDQLNADAKKCNYDEPLNIIKIAVEEIVGQVLPITPTLVITDDVIKILARAVVSSITDNDMLWLTKVNLKIQ